jgi:hypothetical protein
MEVFLEGATVRHGMLAQDAGPRAILNALDRLADSYEAQAATARRDLAIAEGQLRDYLAPLGDSFAEEGYLKELSRLRDDLRAALSDRAPKQESEAATAGELARQIQALKAQHQPLQASEHTLSAGSLRALSQVDLRESGKRLGHNGTAKPHHELSELLAPGPPWPS